MKIVADTNVLLRDALHDDPIQARTATKVLESAELVAIPVAVFCEFVWVAIRRLLRSASVVTNQPAIEAGLDLLDKGGDFADGAIAYEGRWLGGEEFVSFDKQAVSLLKLQGKRARLLA